MYYKVIFIFVILTAVSHGDLPCSQRDTEYGIICVCNSTYCDTLSTPKKLMSGEFHVYYTSSSNPGFNHKTGFFRMQSFSPRGSKIVVKEDTTFQTVRGFGGSFTDSFGCAANTLSNEAQDFLFKSFFSEDGIEYTVCRVALGASDFSLRFYTYVDNYDPSLKSFNLTTDDYIYKINLIKKALNLSKRPIQLFGSAWTAPSWMKTNNGIEIGFMKQEFRQTWADYHVKILDAFKAEGIEFWGLTTGNEAITMYQLKAHIPNLIMFPEEQRDWVIENLGPALERANYSTKIILLDDQRMYALWYMSTVMRHRDAHKYVHGIGLHWYFDNMASPSVMDVIHKKYPDQEMLYTESSINPATKSKATFGLKSGLSDEIKVSDNLLFGEFDPSPPNIGSWHRGALFLRNIIENLKHWVTSYVDWNLSLDVTGGPNIAHFACDATVIINKTSDEFYKNPMFYVMGHFSKFMPPGSKIIDIQSVNSKKFQAQIDPTTTTAFPSPGPEPSPNVTHPWPFPTTPPDYDIKYVGSVNPDGSKTIIFYNPLQSQVEVEIYDRLRGYAYLILESFSITTVIYW